MLLRQVHFWNRNLHKICLICMKKNTLCKKRGLINVIYPNKKRERSRYGINNEKSPCTALMQGRL
jgi:hypothetical protein